MDIENTLQKLTLEEKVQLVAGESLWRTYPIEGAGVPVLKVSDGPNGVRGDGGVAAACLPVGVCMASTWNLPLVEAAAGAIADEAQSKGVQVVLGPTMNIHRTPVGGRNFECYSEDPLLSGLLASAFTDGVQKKGVAACVKHYVCNDSEFERHTISVEVDERTLREIYLRPFEIAVKRSNPWSIMASYNRINGVYACSHDELVNQVLKGEWDYDGLVISDWFAAKETVPNALGGLDLEMPGPAQAWGDKLLTAVQGGEVPEAVIDDKVRRLLRIMDRTGLTEASKEAPEQALDQPEHHELAYQAASEGMVLLKNDGLLPLSESQIQTLAVIGPNIRDFRIMGGGSSTLKPHYVATPLEALANKLPGVNMKVAKGCHTHKYIPPVDPQFIAPSSDANERGLVCRFYRGGITGEMVQERLVSRGTLMLGGMSAGSDPAAPDALTVEGCYLVETGGLHQFGMLSTGRAKMYLGDKLIIDNWTNPQPGDAFFTQASAEVITEVELNAGEKLPLRMEFEADPQNQFRALRYGILPPDPEVGLDAAVAMAESADAVVLIVGTNDDWETEGNDREVLNLPGVQDELIERVVAANPNCVVVNNSGSPIAMPWVDRVPAILQTWFAGQEFGNALTDILTGVVNPSGRLPITFPRRLEDTPAFTSYPGEFGKVRYGEELFVGYRWYDRRDIEPLFAFGHGLSYTTFNYADIKVSKSDGGYRVELDISNTGSRAGQEVVQLYVEPVQHPAARPLRELKAFRKLHLEPGAVERISFELDDEAFQFWDPKQRAWQVTPGAYRLHLGASSRDLRLVSDVEIESRG